MTESAAVQTPQAPARKRRIVIWCTAAMLLVLATLSWGVPAGLRWGLETKGSDILGRQITLEAIRFNPFLLKVGVEGLRIAGPQATDVPVLRVSRLEVDLSLQSLWRMAPVIEGLRVESPVVHVARLADGRYDLDDVLARLSRPASPAGPEDAPLPRFALFNLTVTQGEVEFDDQPTQQRHQLKQLELGVPAVSTLDDTSATATVQPRLAFVLDGSVFDSASALTPFDPKAPERIQLKADQIDLAHWRPYLPQSLPVRPDAGRLSFDLALGFAHSASGVTGLALSGQAALADLKLVDRTGSALLMLGQLKVDLASLDLQKRTVDVRAVSADGLRMPLARNAQGRWGFESWWPAAPAGAAPQGAPSTAWQVKLARFDAQDWRSDVEDAAVRPAAHWALLVPQFSVRDLHWPLHTAESTQLEAALGLVAADRPAGTVRLTAQLNRAGGEARIGADDWTLPPWQPYLAKHLRVRLDGTLATEAKAVWLGEPGAALPKVEVSALRLARFRAVLGERRASVTVAAWPLLALDGLTLDLEARTARLAGVNWTQPSVSLSRNAEGRLSLDEWLVPAPQADGAQAQPTPALATDKPWQMTLARAAVSGGRVQWRDDAPGHEPVAVDVNDLKLQAAGLTWPARPAETLALSGSLRLGAPGARPAGLGLLSWQGRLGLAPVAWVGKVQADRLPLQTMGAYLTPGLPVKLESLLASGTLDGTAALAEGGPSLALRGALQLADLHLAESAEEDVSGRDLLSWQRLTLDGLALQLAPQQRPKLAVASAALSEVFARLVVTERGRLNFNSLAAVPEPAASAAAVPAATPKPTLAPIIEVGGVQISRGRVDFADRFIRPNYRTDLTELNGRLGAFSSEAGAQQSATLELNGKAAGTATLAVRGSLKPTVQPLQLDIQARASDLELAPLSPYAGKYAGYAIERGKLTMDVAYRIEADGTLQARNQLLLNQLTFGERIESPDATRLPVQLAVALLKDRNGVIDLNLPISGSVNDPQFSVGALIFKVLGNVLSKAVTAPFALLSGGDETVQNVVAFLPGSADLSADARAQLSTLAGKLAERPALTMTVTGLADLASEQDALRASWLQGRLRAEARREALRAGAAEDTVQLELTPAKALEMLERVYSDAKLPNKPRNVLGLAKRLPAEDMASLLRASAPVTEESVRELALQRGIAVRDALLARGLPSERLFMAAPRWQAPAASDGTWAPRVELSLAMP